MCNCVIDEVTGIVLQECSDCWQHAKEMSEELDLWFLMEDLK